MWALQIAGQEAYDTSCGLISGSRMTNQCTVIGKKCGPAPESAESWFGHISIEHVGMLIPERRR